MVCVCVQGNHITTRQLEEMGKKFCDGLIKVHSRHLLKPPAPLAMASNSAGLELQAHCTAAGVVASGLAGSELGEAADEGVEATHL